MEYEYAIYRQSSNEPARLWKTFQVGEYDNANRSYQEMVDKVYAGNRQMSIMLEDRMGNIIKEHTQ